MRYRILTGMIGVFALIVSGFAAAPAQAANDATTDQITVSGYVMVFPREGKAPTKEEPEPEAPHGEDVALAVDNGPIVALADVDPSTYQSGSRFQGSLRVPAKVSALVASKASASASPKSFTAAVLGAASDSRTALPVGNATVTPAVSASGAMAHTVDVMTLGYTGDSPASSDTDIRTSINSLNTYWKRESNGQITSINLQGSILHRNVSPGSLDICDAYKSWNYALSSAGFNKPASYYLGGNGHHMIVLLPDGRCPNSPWWGIALLGSSIHTGGPIAILLEREAPIEHNVVFFHEFGHTVSLPHSAQRTCTGTEIDAPYSSGGSVSSPCTDTPYADVYDVMGGPTTLVDRSGNVLATNLRYPAALNLNQRVRINATGSTKTITASGGGYQTAIVKPADSSPSGVRGLKIKDPKTGDYLYVEYRYPTSVDKLGLYPNWAKYYDNPKYAPGVRIMRNTPQSSSNRGLSVALSRHVGASDQFMWWPTGSTATTYNGNIKVKVLSTSSSGAKVGITMAGGTKNFTTVPTPKIKASPSASIGWGTQLTATGAGGNSWSPAATSVKYQWQRSGKAIAGATKQTYLVTGADIGKPIRVMATGSRSGYKTTSKVSAVVVPRRKPSVKRLSGPSRYETAVEVSKEAFPPGKTAPVVYIATGLSFADALSAAPAAARKGGALLLVPNKGKVPPAVTGRVKQLAPKKIVVVGGNSAVNGQVVAQIRAARPSATVKRISGRDRYQTSRMIVKDAWGTSRVTRVFVATGANFPDALAASAAAGKSREPVVLVNGAKGTMPSTTSQMVNAMRPSRAYVIGGTSSVSAGIEKQLKAKRKTVRLSGKDRYLTAVRINQTFFNSTTVPQNFWATGATFPDALGGAVLAAKRKSPLYTVQRDCVPSAVAMQAARKRTSRVTIFGGDSTLTRDVAGLKIC